MKHLIYQGYKRKYGKINFTLLIFGFVLFLSLLVFGIDNFFVVIGFVVLLYIQYNEGKKKQRMLISAACPTCGQVNAVIEPLEYGATFKTECINQRSNFQAFKLLSECCL